MGVSLAVAAFLALSWTAHHHWDEFFYLFSSAVHTPRELMRLDAAVDLFPQGYFSGKIGHVVLLHALTGMVGDGREVLLGLEALYAALVLAAVGAGWGLFRELLPPSEARRTALVLLCLPVTGYLAYKLLSEVPSLLLTTLGCWAFVRGFRASRRRDTAVLLGAAAALLAGGMLCRVTSVLAFGGLVLGLLAGGDPRFPRRAVLVRAALVGAGALVLHATVLELIGGSEIRLLLLAQAVADQAKLFERVTAFLLFVQGFGLLLPLALRRPWPPALRTGWVWLVVTMLPNLSGHEPRYYTPALLPFALVCAAGLGRAAELAAGRWRTPVWAAGLAALVLIDRVTLFPLMPTEVDQASLSEVAADLGARHPTATVLVPWLSDYCYLRFVHPALSVRLAVSAMPTSRYPGRGRWGEIAPADRQWAGPDRYIGSLPALVKASQPWYYVGWSYNPVMLRVRGLLEEVGIDLLGDPRNTGWHDHLAGSWIWTDSSLTRREVGGEGQYRVFRILRDVQPGARGPTTSPTATTNVQSARPVKLANAAGGAAMEGQSAKPSPRHSSARLRRF